MPSEESLNAQKWVENLEKIVREKQGCSLAESFERFRKKQNEGMFLLSDMKKILDSMSPEELDEPLFIEVMGPMTYESHNLTFEAGRTMNLVGHEVPSTGPVLRLTEKGIALSAVTIKED